MRSRTIIALAAVALLGSHARVAAQERPLPRFQSAAALRAHVALPVRAQVGSSPLPGRRPSRPYLVVGGATAGSAIGTATGVLLGWALGGGGRSCGDDPCGFVSALVGGAVGATAGAPMGAHLANARSGDLGLDLLGSVLALIPGALIGAWVGDVGADADAANIGLVAIPLTQIAVSALV